MHRVTDREITEVVAGHTAHRLAVMVFEHPLDGQRGVVVAVGAAKTSTVTLLVPLFAVAWGAVFLAETLTPSMVFFCAVILLGTALTTGILHWPVRQQA
jgi:hypothetical protein